MKYVNILQAASFYTFSAFQTSQDSAQRPGHKEPPIHRRGPHRQGCPYVESNRGFSLADVDRQFFYRYPGCVPCLAAVEEESRYRPGPRCDSASCRPRPPTSASSAGLRQMVLAEVVRACIRPVSRGEEGEERLEPPCNIFAMHSQHIRSLLNAQKRRSCIVCKRRRFHCETMRPQLSPLRFWWPRCRSATSASLFPTTFHSDACALSHWQLLGHT